MRDRHVWVILLFAGLLQAAACSSDPCHPRSPELATQEECVPVLSPSGVPEPDGTIYMDRGEVDPTDEFRALMGFLARNRDELELRIRNMYDPDHPDFRSYITTDEWLERYAPTREDFDTVKGWLLDQGFQVNFEATNRLLIHFSGTASQFQEAFQVPLNECLRENPASGGAPLDVYCVTREPEMPKIIADLVHGVVTADLPADPGELPGEAGDINTHVPDNVNEGYSVEQMAYVYGIDDLHAAGYTGQGVTLGVVVGATFRFKDLQSFWQSFGVTREDPVVVETAEPVITRYRETTLDVQWSAAMAPDADVIVYEGPDARNTSMVYAFNEAVGQGEVSVIANSFAHREDAEPYLVRHQYSETAMMGAALGITVVVASGDSARPDTPSASPYSTSVGGTYVRIQPDGSLVEVSWSQSGSGHAKTFPLPYWQEELWSQRAIESDTRAVSDVALHASVEVPYWMYYLQDWKRYGGTSFSAPVFAGLMAAVNSYRLEQGLPVAGYLNPVLYQDKNVQATFRDIVTGGTDMYSAHLGWDYPTGWGAPRALDLAKALP